MSMMGLVAVYCFDDEGEPLDPETRWLMSGGISQSGAAFIPAVYNDDIEDALAEGAPVVEFADHLYLPLAWMVPRIRAAMDKATDPDLKVRMRDFLELVVPSFEQQLRDRHRECQARGTTPDPQLSLPVGLGRLGRLWRLRGFVSIGRDVGIGQNYPRLALDPALVAGVGCHTMDDVLVVADEAHFRPYKPLGASGGVLAYPKPGRGLLRGQAVAGNGIPRGHRQDHPRHHTQIRSGAWSGGSIHAGYPDRSHRVA